MDMFMKLYGPQHDAWILVLHLAPGREFDKVNWVDGGIAADSDVEFLTRRSMSIRCKAVVS